MAADVDAIVVGCGIVGAACAYELSSAGLRVTICEQNEYVGGGATAAGMGHLAVMDDSAAQFALTSYSQQLWHQLSSQLPPNCEYLACGSLWIAADADELQEVHRKFSFYRERNLPSEVLDPKQLAEAEPNLRPGLAGALRLPHDAVCYPPAAARYLANRVVAAHGQLLLNKTVHSLAGRRVFFDDGTSLASDIIVLATGAAIRRIVPEVEMQPRKGHLLITDRHPGFLRHQIIELGYLKSAHSTSSDSVAFNAQPRLTGQILLGSSRQYGIETTEIDHAVLRAMLRKAIDYMPGLRNLSVVRTWTGFRAATPDKLPLIGKLPGHENVYLATGHEGLGISTSLATGRLLADEILERDSQISRLPYQPARNFVVHA